jgi:hypothetical protein
MDQGSGVADKVDRPCNHAKILLAFVGASPQNIYSFVSAINIQMRLNIIYNIGQIISNKFILIKCK